MHKAIKVPMIPIHEEAGKIYAYVGDGEPTEPFASSKTEENK